MGRVLVGRDVFAYAIQGFGHDTIPQTAGADTAAYNLLGRWRRISVEFQNEWFDVTPSDAENKERRRGAWDWRATCENLMRSGLDALYGASGDVPAAKGLQMAVASAQDYVCVMFTEETGGSSVTLYGGIDRARFERDREAGIDTLEVICVGNIGPGGVSISYGP